MLIINQKKFIFICIYFLLSNHNVFSFIKAPVDSFYKSNADIRTIPLSELYLNNDKDWIVFSDREENQLFNDYNGKVKSSVKLNYLDSCKVLDKKGHFIQLSKVEKESIIGWGRVENFLLIQHAAKTENLITNKALIINRLAKIKGNTDFIIPLKAPYENSLKTNNKIKLLDFAHIYQFFPNQENPKYILIGKNPFFVGKGPIPNLSIDEVLLGWVPADRILIWNTREALEPNKSRKHPIYYFEDKKYLDSYYSSHKYSNEFPKCSNIPICLNKKMNNNNILVVSPDSENDFDKTPWPPEKFRFSILTKNNDPLKPFHIGISGAKLHEERIRQYIEKGLEKAANRDIVFVVDATYSMEPYIALVGDIVKNVMNEFINAKKEKKEIGELRFAAYAYRDYFAGDKVFEKIISLTSNTNEVSKRLYSIKSCVKGKKVNTINKKTFYPEAVFQGIIQSIQKANWSIFSRRMIIHIGDMGNHGKKDNYKIDDIVELLVKLDISYHAIQIVDKKEKYKEAQQLFCKQSISIINKTIEKSIKNFKLLNEKEQVLSDQQTKQVLFELNKLTDSSLNPNCCNNNRCCETNVKSRWSLRCIEANNYNKYKQTIEKRINSITKEVIETRSLISDIIIGNLNIKGSDNNVSYKPQLMPGVIDRLIYNIGIDIFRGFNINTLKKLYPQINEIQNFENKQSFQIKRKIINLLGAYELKKYLKKDAQFFTEAYVMFKRPGKKFTQDPNQFKKIILFEKREFEKILTPLKYFLERYKGNLTSSNIKDIWRSLLSAIIGQKQSENVLNNSKITIDEAYKKQFGISLNMEHILLKIPYSQIVSGLMNLDEQSKEKLRSSLCDIASRLKDIYEDDAKFFNIFGTKYIWIDSTELP